MINANDSTRVALAAFCTCAELAVSHGRFSRAEFCENMFRKYSVELSKYSSLKILNSLIGLGYIKRLGRTYVYHHQNYVQYITHKARVGELV